MNTQLYIAKRYLFSKKSTNAINIISGISMAGVFVGSAALVIILSVFNGFEDIVVKMFNTFSPNVLITPAKGKTFNPNTAYFNNLQNDKNVLNYAEILAENAVIKYGDKQAVGLIKGVSDGYFKAKNLENTLISGSYSLKNKDTALVVIGSTLQSYLLTNRFDKTTTLDLYSPSKGNNINLLSGSAFNIESVFVRGVFEIQQEYDNIAIASIELTRKLFSEPVNVTSIEINFKDGVDEELFKQKIENDLGANFIVQNRLEQNRVLYNVLNSEKWMVYIILTFILIIAIFNIIGSLTMLVIDKSEDIKILHSLGADKTWIKRIFLFEGMMITLIGCFSGLLVGFVFCLLQQKYGLISMNSTGLMGEEPYPVSIKLIDFVLVFLTVSSLSFIASAIASNLSVKNIKELKA
ncbi:ABC transporter permease [Pedobacter flavus]|uniref:ABC transporter permease n=1 Tax=Pedobacter flavus TaxID=3113906 RepID=A0ABU7GZT4_9SPHI|nr:ABC transporter permease [Pedobacter sp. VNH31]MEE1884593.1 ABC transporter permease [Pedobacter sp. VNH31]